MKKYDPFEQEKLVCQITGQYSLQPIYRNDYFPTNQQGKELRWYIRVPIPGMGTEKRRVWDEFYGKDLQDLWGNVIFGCGWSIDSETLEYYQKSRWDRDTKQWVRIKGAA